MNFITRWMERRMLRKNRLQAPQTLEAGVEALLIKFNKMKDGAEWAELPENAAMGKAHHGFGTWLRNNWGLWLEDHPLHLHFKKVYGIWHADDMSGILLTCLHREMNDKPWGINSQVQYYKDFWDKNRLGTPIR